MMENRSFDHFLGWLPGADGRQAGLQYRRLGRRPAPDHAPHRVPGLRHRRPRPLVRGRPHPVRRRRVRRLAARRQRRVLDRLLHRRRICRSTGNAAPVLDRRATTTSRRSWPDVPEPLLHARRRQTDRLHEHDGTSPRRCRRSGTALAAAERQPPLLLLRRAVHRALGHQATSASASPYSQFLADCKRAERCRRSRSSTRASSRRRIGHVGRRPPARRHPRRRVRSSTRSTRRSRAARAGRTRCSSSTSTSGAASSTTCRRATAPDVNPTYRRRGFRVPVVLISPFARRGRRRRARHVRPHVGAAR